MDAMQILTRMTECQSVHLEGTMLMLRSLLFLLMVVLEALLNGNLLQQIHLVLLYADLG